MLMSPKDMRKSIYVGASGGEFLSLLYNERHLLDLYAGQTLVFDPDEGEVPKDLRTFRLGEDELKHFINFEWSAIDFLNGIYLKIRGEEAGTQFQKYNTGNTRGMSSTTRRCWTACRS